MRTLLGSLVVLAALALPAAALADRPVVTTEHVDVIEHGLDRFSPVLCEVLA